MLEKQNKDVALNKLKLQIGESWYRLHLLFEKLDLLQYQDSLYLHVLKAAETRYETGESTLLEKLSVETRCQELKNNIQELQADINIAKKGLNVLINDTVEWNFSPLSDTSIDKVFILEKEAIAQNPSLSVQKQKAVLAVSEKGLQKAKMLPDLSIGYFNQSLIGIPLESGSLATSSDRFVGVRAGIKVPLFFGSYSNKIKAASIHAQQMQAQAQYYESILQNEYEQQRMVLVKHQNSLDRYSATALPQADMLIKHAEVGLRNEAIHYEEYIKAIDRALEIKNNHLKKKNKVQIAQIQLSYLMGN
jgi:cobalt-zinc-cadmium resistance protein CzcA